MNLRRISIIIGLLSRCYIAMAQDNWNLVWREDFGVASDTVIKNFPDVNSTVPQHCFMEQERYCVNEVNGGPEHNYQNICLEYACRDNPNRLECGQIDDGYYGIANSTWWAYNRFGACSLTAGHFIGGRDHTGNKNGAMLIVNSGVGEGAPIFEKKIEFNLCDTREYKFVVFASSITSYGNDDPANGDVSGGNADLELIIKNATTDQVVKRIKTGPIPFWTAAGWGDNSGGIADPYAERTWSEYSCTFTARDGDILNLQVVNWGNGYNDFTIDDISLFRNDADVKVIDPVITTNTKSSESNASAGACIYTASFSVMEEVLTSWKGIYDEVYLLWQQSTDDGLTWQNITSVSGIDKREIELEVDKDIPTVYRVIITGGSNATVAEQQALDIAANGAPLDGCAYFSISNTLAGVSPTPDCSFAENGRIIWKEDFGVIDSFSTRNNPDVPLTYYEPYDENKTNGLEKGDYVIVSVPVTAIMTTSKNWDGTWNNPSYDYKNEKNFSDASGKKNGGMLYTYLPKASTRESENLIYQKVINGPLCKCKSFAFTYLCYDQNEWAGEGVLARIIDDNGNVLAEQETLIGHDQSKQWYRTTVPFTVPTSYNGNITVQLYNTTPQNDWNYLAFDDLRVSICGESTPKGTVEIKENTTVEFLGGFDCNEERHVAIADDTEWKKLYPNYGFAWQESEDGVNWEYVSSDKELTYDGEGTLLQYRAVFGENEEAAVSTARNGKPSDPCLLYDYSNIVGLKCKMLGCKAPAFSFATDSIVNICSNQTEKVEFEAKQSNNTNIDQLQWYSSPADQNNWTEMTGENLAKLSVLPLDSTDYMFIAVNDTCRDTIYARINVYKEITLKNITDKKICEGSTLELTAEVLTGKPTTYIWNGEGKGENTISLTDLSVTQDITLSATDGICTTEVMTVNVEVEKKYVPDWATTIYTICEGTEKTFTLNSLLTDEEKEKFENTHTSSWKKDGTEISTAFSESFTFNESCELVHTISSAVCEDVKTPFTITVEKQPKALLDVDKTVVCEGDQFTLSPTLTNAITAEFIRIDEDGEEQKMTDSDESLIVVGSSSASYYLRIPESVCQEVSSDTILVKVVKKLDFSFPPVAPEICAGTEITLSATKEGGDYDNAGWTKNGTTASDQLSFTDSPSETSTYTFTASVDGCPNFTKDINVTVEVATDLTVTSEKEKICDGDIINLVSTYGTATILEWQYSTDNVSFTKFSDNLANSESFASTELLTGAYFFRLKTIGQGICPEIFSATAKVEVEPKLDIEWGDNILICAGASITVNSNINNNVPYTYSWKVNGVEISTEEEPTISDIDETSIIEEIITGEYCPSVSHTYSVSVNNPVVLNLTTSTNSICDGDKVTLNLDYDYAKNISWIRVDDQQNQEVFSSELTNKLEVSPNEHTSYFVKYDGDEVCPQTIFSDTIDIAVEKPIMVALDGTGESYAICYGKDVTFTAKQTSGLTDRHQWLKNGVNVSDEYSFTEIPEESATYEFIAEGEYCKADTLVVNVAVEKSSPLTLALSETKICEGSDLTLNATFGESTSLIWESSADGNTYETISNELMPTLTQTPIETTYYRLRNGGLGVCAEEFSNVEKIDVEKKIQFTIDPIKDVICLGDMVNLNAHITAGSKNNFAWQSSSSSLAERQESLVDQPTTPTTYTFYAQGDVCPKEEATFNVDVEIPTTLTLTASEEKICNGSSFILTSDFGTAKSIDWEKSEDGETFVSFAEDMTETKDMTPSLTTSYRLKTSGESACPEIYSAIVTVEVEQPVTVNLPNDVMICPGDEKVITAEISGAPVSFKWISTTNSGVESEEQGTENSLNVTPQTTTTYKLKLNADVCEDAEDEMTVQVDEIPTLDFTISANEICEGDVVSLATTYSYPEGITWWEKIGNGSFTEIGKGETGLSLTPTENATYKVSAISQARCNAGELTEQVKVDKAVEITIDDKQICVGDSVRMRINGLKDHTNIAWDNGKSTSEIMLSPMSTTEMNVTVTNGKCEQTATSEITVISAPKIISCEEADMRVYQITTESDLQPVYYTFGDGRSKTIEDQFTVSYGKTYNIVATNELGCKSETFILETPTYDIVIPIVFVPEHKNWKVENLERYANSKVTIYDRFGKKLAEYTSDNNEGWDGTYNGKKMPTTDYWYNISIGEIAKTYNGHFTLMRGEE